MKEKGDRTVVSFEGKAMVSSMTETTKLGKDGSVEETTVFSLQVDEEDGGRHVTMKQGTPFDVRPGERLAFRVERTQQRLEDIEA